jgi:hypothetical protein
MRHHHLAVMLSFFLICLTAQPGTAALEVTLDSGVGSQIFTDDDADGTVDFDATIAGIFQATGTAKELHEKFKTSIALSPLSPDPEAVFRNLSASPQTFTVTVKSSILAASIGPPLGWDVFYNGTADDVVDMSIDIPSHSVSALANDASLALGTLTGAALTGTSAIEIAASEHGVAPDDLASDVTMVWTFTLGAHDEIRVASDDDFEGESIQVNVFNQSQKCVDKMNNGARKVGDAAQKADAACMKTTGADVTACVDEAADKQTEKKEQSVIDSFATKCDPLPAWGVSNLSCCNGGTNEDAVCTDSSTCGGGECTAGACIPAAAETGANDLAHDLYSATVVVSSDRPTAKCQQAVSKALGLLYTERWKAFRGCKRDNFTTIIGDVVLKTTCLEPQPDSKQKIAKREAKLEDTVQKKCIDKGVTGLGAVFPGACSAVADTAVGACAADRAACRFCRSANRADAILPPENCDLFDDALANTSCDP